MPSQNDVRSTTYKSVFEVSWLTRLLGKGVQIEGTSLDKGEDEADRLRRQAEERRGQAGKAVSPLDRKAWLRLAEEWLKLAQSVEDRRRHSER